MSLVVKPEIFTIKRIRTGTLSQMAAPNPLALEEAISALKAAEINVVVSMLTPEDEAGLGLADEDELCSASGLEFLRLPTPDFTAPEPQALAKAATDIVDRLAQGKKRRDPLPGWHRPILNPVRCGVGQRRS